MSHRMCAQCKAVVNNRCYNKDDCPECGSLEWASPLDHNDEWALLYKAQFKIKELEARLERLSRATSVFEVKSGHHRTV